MSTIYILHGGNTTKSSVDNDAFFEEFTSNTNKDEVTVTVCYFALEKDRWKEKLEKDKAMIQAQTSKNINFLLPHNFEELVESMKISDVLYVRGGSLILDNNIGDTKQLKSVLDGKTFIGSSMGAFWVSEGYVCSFLDQFSETVYQGHALVPYQVLCHWDIEPYKSKKVDMLQENSHTEILTLNECEYTKFEA